MPDLPAGALFTLLCRPTRLPSPASRSRDQTAVGLGGRQQISSPERRLRLGDTSSEACRGASPPLCGSTDRCPVTRSAADRRLLALVACPATPRCSVIVGAGETATPGKRRFHFPCGSSPPRSPRADVRSSGGRTASPVPQVAQSLVWRVAHRVRASTQRFHHLADGDGATLEVLVLLTSSVHGVAGTVTRVRRATLSLRPQPRRSRASSRPTKRLVRGA